jgi:hypothetical protein
MSSTEELDLDITVNEFFRIVAGEEIKGLKFLKTVNVDQPGKILSFFHKLFYFTLGDKKVHANLATVVWETGDIQTTFTHGCGEPSEVGPRFVESSPEEIAFAEKSSTP